MRGQNRPRVFLGGYRIVLVSVNHRHRNNGRMRSHWLNKVRIVGVAIWVLGILALGASSILQRSITLAWDPSTDPSVVGYRVYVGSACGVYTNVIDVGAATTVSVPGLTVGATYYFAVTAYNSLGVESPSSGEISCVVPPPPNSLQTSQIAGAKVINGTGWKSGQAYNILASQDLASWQVIGTVTADASGSFQFTDPASINYPSRFYRAETISPPRRLQISRISGATVLNGTGWNSGQTCNILASEDLVSWQVIGTATAGASGSFQFTDQASSNYRSRFYRAKVTSP